ncbi:MAG: FAD-dependent oxidoreductase [Hespellia sp.]|nr:FAD-dependent oxidoreductase [Hespellia sp.]
MGKYDALFSPMKVGTVEVKNRFALMPMGIHSARLVNPDGSFTDDGIRYYERIAEGGVGLIITSAITVQGKFDNSKGSHSSLDKAGPEYIERSQKLTDRIHKAGSKIFLQLSGGSGRTLPMMVAEGEPIAASDDMPNVWDPSIKHRGLTKDEIQFYIDSFAHGAKLAKEAGFDGVEIHAIHEGYLIDQFTIAFFNRRMDEYGGNLEGRLLFPKKIVEAIKEACGNDFPVSVRFSVRSMIKDFNSGAIPGEDFIEAGRDLEEGIQAAQLLEKYGYDMLNGDNGTYDSWWYPHPPVYMPEACNLEDCAEVQKHVSIPVLCAGRMENPAIALDAVESGKVSGVGIARQFLADPDYCNKLKEGNVEDIRPCIACHEGCLKRIFKGQDMCCALNPAVCREDTYELKPAMSKKKVMVIGGGIGGMEAARVCALRGHEVTLYEKTDKLGGMFIPASGMTFKESDKRLIAWYERQMDKCGVAVYMNTTVTDKLIQKETPDVVFRATGSIPRELNLPGVENDYVLNAVEALNHPEKVKGDIVIVGGGLTGIEIAYDHAKNGENVTVLEAMDKALNVDIAAANLLYLKEAIKYYKIPIVTNANITSFENNVVTYNISGKEENVHADTVIISIGYTSNPQVNDSGAEFYTIGDADHVSNLLGAIWSAYEQAMNV